MKITLSRPDITEREIDSVVEVLRSPNLSLGPKLTEFEQAFSGYIGRQHAIAVNSGTSALHLSLLALGIGPGDEVITSPFTFIASATSIMMVGATPVLADIDADTLNMDTVHLQNRLTPHTKAILPVEVFGNPAGMDKIRSLAQSYQLYMVEDSCEALGSELHGQKAGTFGDLSVFAFYPNKQITTGEGGMILTDNQQWADLCVSLRNQGRGESSPWLAHERLGYNYRLSDIHCALGLVQLSRLQELNAKRTRVAKWYHERLLHDERLIIPQAPPNSQMSWFVFVVRLQNEFTRQERDAILDQLTQKGIQVSNYFPPIHLQPFMVRQFGYKSGDFPIAESISERTIALPFHTHLTEADIDFVCEKLIESLDGITHLSTLSS